jgi:hypothetical protein
MSSRDLHVLASSFVHGFRDAILGFVFFYRINQDPDANVSLDKARPITVTELQRRRAERMPQRPEKKSEYVISLN